jgi:hypothetical protein
MQDRFDREVDLEGRKWQERNAVYKKWLRTHGYASKTVLRKDDDLYNAVTDHNSYVVEGDNLAIDTSGWPPYWHAQHAGSVVGRGVKLPERSFAGISETAQFEIIDIFDDWLEGNLRLVRPGVTGVSMFRGAFGRIAGKVTDRPPRREILPFFKA